MAATTAGAQAAPRLDYRATTGCPESADFLAAVRARGGNIAVDAASTGEIEVVIEHADGDYRGTVRVRSAGQSSEAREVRSPQCAEVADGLAIVTALASQTGSIASEPAAASDGTSAPRPPPPKAPPPPSDTPKPAPAASTRLHTLGQFHNETLAVTNGELRIRNDTAFTLSGGALFGIVPGAAVPRVDFTIARTNFITTPDGAGHIVGGILRTRWTVLAPTEYRQGDWSAQFFGLTASVGGCSQLAYDLQGFVLLLCGEVGAGVAKLTTKDPNGHTTKDETVGLGSAAIELDARYNLGRLFHLGLTAGGEAWLTELKAHRSDGSEFFHTNPVGAYVSAGIGMHFW